MRRERVGVDDGRDLPLDEHLAEEGRGGVGGLALGHIEHEELHEERSRRRRRSPEADAGRIARCILVREHYATFVAHAESTYSAPLPRYVKDAFERYLACGDFSQGFVRCHCDACRHDVLVAFSCKQRGLCPSCGARRMCDVAANVTDAIFPYAPVRQWVLSLRTGRDARRA